MKKTWFAAACLFSALSSIPLSAARAEEGMVSVTYLKGEAKVMREGQAIPLKVGDTCWLNDTLITEPGATMDISVNDCAGSRVLPESEIVLADTQKSDMRIKVSKGNIIMNLDRLPKGSTFKVETPTAVAVARGTQFWGRVQQPQSNSPLCTFAVREGVIDVMTIDGSKSFTLREGQALDIPKDLAGPLKVRNAVGHEIATMEQSSIVKTCS